MIEYTVLEVTESESSPRTTLERMVSDYIAQGWQPLGGVCHSYQTGTRTREQKMVQAMTRERRGATTIKQGQS